MIYKVIFENNRGKYAHAISLSSDFAVGTIQYYFNDPDTNRFVEFVIVEAESKSEAIKLANELFNNNPV